MSFRALHTWVTYALAGTGLFALSLGAELGPLSLAAFALGYGASLFVPRTIRARASYQRAFSYGVVGYVVLGVARYATGESLLTLGIELAGALQVIKLLQRHEAKDDHQIQILSFLHLIAATILSSGVEYALVFFGYVLLVPWAFALTHLRAEVEANYGPARDPEHGAARVDRILASKRLAGWRFLFATASLALPLFLVTAAFFLLFPRVGMGFLSFGGEGRQVSGFSGEVELGGFGVIRSDPTVVLRVLPDLPAETLPPQMNYRLRGTSFDHYDRARWTRSDDRARTVRGEFGVFPLRAVPGGRERRLQIVLDALEPPVLFLPQGTIAVELSPRVEAGVDVARRLTVARGLDVRYDDGDGLQIRYVAIVDAGEAHEVSAEEEEADEEGAIAAGDIAAGDEPPSRAVADAELPRRSHANAGDETPHRASADDETQRRANAGGEPQRADADDEMPGRVGVEGNLSGRASGSDEEAEPTRANTSTRRARRSPRFVRDVMRELDDEERARYLQLPEDLPPRIRELAEEIAGEGSELLRARRVEAWLRYDESFHYSLTLPDTAGRDPLEVFLLEARSGHCEYFATALAVMLRTLGIPTRNVTGFVGGTLNPYGGYYTVSQGDAHSWVEAWVGGRWRTFDPTPSARADHMPSSDGVFASIRAFVDAMRTRWDRDVVGYDLRRQVEGLRGFFRWLRGFRSDARSEPESSRPSARARATPDWPWAGAAFAGLAALALVLRRLRRSRSARGARPAAATLYEALDRRLTALGLARPPGRTPSEHVAHLRAAGYLGADVVDEVTSSYLRARWGDAALSRPRIRELRSAIRALPGAAPSNDGGRGSSRVRP